MANCSGVGANNGGAAAGVCVAAGAACWAGAIAGAVCPAIRLKAGQISKTSITTANRECAVGRNSDIGDLNARRLFSEKP